MSTRALSRLILAILLTGICVGCGQSVRPEFTYRPAFLPVEFSLGKTGISVTGDDQLVTPIGSFSIGARYELPPKQGSDIYVILRNRSTGYDHIFEVYSGRDQFMAIVNGTTSISITNDQVLIDVTSGNIKKIAFKRVNNQIAERSSTNWFASTWHKTVARWDTGWRQSWYKPFGLSRWAYDDSTIERWYGVGFVWFLLRLIFAIVLALIDIVLTLGFLLGQVGFMIFGPTGRDVIYGLLVLLVLTGVGIGIAEGL